ncbi:putative 115 kDa protein in type-1 retrotransposable element R1DM [Aphomia sociella]
MAHRLLQANINHCARAQDLLMQSVAQWSIDVVVAAEPYRVPDRSNWFGDLVGSVAVFVPYGTRGCPLPLAVLARGEGYVVVGLGETVVAGVYFSPNRSLSDFEDFLDGLGTVLRLYSARPVLVMGDFNAKSAAWGSPVTDARGRDLEEWATTADLTVLNRGSVATCVRWQGESIVDISFANAAAAHRVRNWYVMEGVETLSDHRYIWVDVSASSGAPDGRLATGIQPFPRWALKHLRKDVLMEASIVQAWSHPEGPVEVEQEATWFREALTKACDAAMPRTRAQPPRRQVYWWSEEIAEVRRQCVAARRRYTRSRRRWRFHDADEEAQLYVAYKEKKKALQLSISRAKTRAWQELLETLDRDPWGRPYRSGEQVVPGSAGVHPPLMVPTNYHESGAAAGVPSVTLAELGIAVDKLRGVNKAPGPDGIPGRALVVALDALGDRLRTLFTSCLESGQFPRDWKTGRLVLLRKPGRLEDSPSSFRPLVLLDEVGKLFERVVAHRLVQHLSREGPDLSAAQYGFRGGRSTVDAVQRLKALSDEVVSRGGVLLAVSLDIENAFNTLPWSTIKEALKYHRVPPYLQRIIGDYLRDRAVIYEGQDGELHRKEMTRGVPQGSVLGPILWDIGYDWVLRGPLPAGAQVICYADDTLATARGREHRTATRRANEGVALVVGRIRRLGLSVALHKSEALFFHGPRQRPPPGSHVTICGVRVEVKSQMRYLGLDLDSRWSFRAHFKNLAPRLMAAAGGLGRLLPNIGGPGRQAAVSQSFSAGDGEQGRSGVSHHLVRGGMCPGGYSPWDLEAKVCAQMYEWRADQRRRGSTLRQERRMPEDSGFDRS